MLQEDCRWRQNRLSGSGLPVGHNDTFAPASKRRATLPVEGPAWLLGNFAEHWSDPSRRERLLTTIQWLEGEPSLLGASAHLMAIGRKVL